MSACSFSDFLETCWLWSFTVSRQLLLLHVASLSPPACLGSFSGVSHYSKQPPVSKRTTKQRLTHSKRCTLHTVDRELEAQNMDQQKQQCLQCASCSSPPCAPCAQAALCSVGLGVSQWREGLTARRGKRFNCTAAKLFPSVSSSIWQGLFCQGSKWYFSRKGKRLPLSCRT